MSTTSRGTAHGPDLRAMSIILLELLIVIHCAKAIDYAAYRTDAIPRGVTRENARTTRDILEGLNLQRASPSHDLQDGTEHLLQYGALLRTQILDTFGKLVYDHYDDFGMSQIEALYRIYRETLERKYNIFDIVPMILEDPDTRPTRICAHINERVRTCLKESSEACMNIGIHDEPHPATVSEPALNVTRQIYRLADIPRHYPNGFSLDAVLEHLRARRIRFTPALFSGLLHNVQYDSFDDRVRTAERELVFFLNRSPRYFASKMTEEASADAASVSQLLKSYLTDNGKIFSGKASEHAAYLAQHVVREVDAVSENIELLGTVYDNATINLGYLFKLILPNDAVDRDVLEARDYLLRELVRRNIVESHLRVEKYQQAGPDQLLMEILGQLRDIEFAEDIVTSLHCHARFWHRSHMIENLNELLELFDAYENLRRLPDFAGLMEAADTIKNNLRDSRNVTVQLLCSRPRACLRIGLEIVLNCSIINEETKGAIKEFVGRTSCGCSCLVEDSQVVHESTTRRRNQGDSMITTKVPPAIGAKETGNSTSDISDKPSIISSSIMESPGESAEISSSSSNFTDYDDDYDTDSGYNYSSEYDEKSREERSKESAEMAKVLGKNLPVGIKENESTEKRCKGDCRSGECSGINCSTVGCTGDDCPKRGNCTGAGCIEGKECEGPLCQDSEIGRDNCEGPDCELNQTGGNCMGADCPVNSKEIHPDCEGSDCVRNSTGIDCVGPDCFESSCVDGNCEVSSGSGSCEGDDCESSSCEGDDCESSSCEGDDCEGKSAVGNSCVGPDCKDENDQCQGPNCPATSCVGDDCKTNASLIVCKGPDCPESLVIENCEGADCLGAKGFCEGPDCSGNGEIKCLGDNCPAESAKTDCADGDCSGPAGSGKIECEGSDCLGNLPACTGEDCRMGTHKETCSGPGCSENSTKLGASKGANSKTEEMDESCEGEDCFDVTSEGEVCEGPDCSDLPSININCNGPDCGVDLTEIKCDGSDCSVSESEFKANCEGTDCTKLKVKGNCEGPDCPIASEEILGKGIQVDCEGADCPISKAENDCHGPDCPRMKEDSDISCDGADCSISAEDTSEDCEGADCSESESDESPSDHPKVIKKDTKLDCEGADCPKLNVQSNCEGPDCPIVGEELTTDCEGADCPISTVESDCDGPDCPIVGKAGKIDCKGADCPKLKVKGNCEGPDCPIVDEEILGKGMKIDCEGADCPISTVENDCDGPDCPRIKEDSDIRCDGSDCSISAEDTSEDCKGPDCSESESTESTSNHPKFIEKETETDCEGTDCNISKVENGCDGPDCPTVGKGIKIDCEGADCPISTVENDCDGPDCPISGKTVQIDCKGADCPKLKVNGNCEGPDCPIVDEEILGKGIPIDCEGADCPISPLENDCDGPDCPIVGKGIKIDCEGADCPISTVENDCDGPDCPVSGKTVKIDCMGADCPKLKVKGDCKGPDCPIVGEDLTIDCDGADCPISKVENDCDGPDCPVIGKELTLDCEGADCPKSKVKSDCKGPDCPIVGEDLTIDCEGADCPISKVEKDCDGPDCPVIGKELTLDCKGADCPKLKVKGNCEGPDCPIVDEEILGKGTKIDCEGADCPILTVESDCDGPDCPRMKEDSDISCDGADCSINAEDTSADCEGDDCSESDSAESPCIGPECSKNTEVSCPGGNCPTDIPPPTSKRNRTETSTNTHHQNQIGTFCDHSDPHYKRKLKRLQKMRRIDADSSTPRTWGAIFASPRPISASSKISPKIDSNKIHQAKNPLLRMFGVKGRHFPRHKSITSRLKRPRNQELVELVTRKVREKSKTKRTETFKVRKNDRGGTHWWDNAVEWRAHDSPSNRAAPMRRFAGSDNRKLSERVMKPRMLHGETSRSKHPRNQENITEVLPFRNRRSSERLSNILSELGIKKNRENSSDEASTPRPKRIHGVLNELRKSSRERVEMKTTESDEDDEASNKKDSSPKVFSRRERVEPVSRKVLGNSQTRRSETFKVRKTDRGGTHWWDNAVEWRAHDSPSNRAAPMSRFAGSDNRKLSERVMKPRMLHGETSRSKHPRNQENITEVLPFRNRRSSERLSNILSELGIKKNRENSSDEASTPRPKRIHGVLKELRKSSRERVEMKTTESDEDDEASNKKDSSLKVFSRRERVEPVSRKVLGNTQTRRSKTFKVRKTDRGGTHWWDNAVEWRAHDSRSNQAAPMRRLAGSDNRKVSERGMKL